MPGKRKRGAGWEDEMMAAQERDRISQEDKRVADAIRTAAAADSKKRTGGSMRRKRCKMCGSLPRKGGKLGFKIGTWEI